MKHGTVSETKMSHDVLNLDDGDVASFVRRCVKERSLSKVVADLNHDLLSGTRTERENAEQALHRIGFL